MHREVFFGCILFFLVCTVEAIGCSNSPCQNGGTCIEASCQTGEVCTQGSGTYGCLCLGYDYHLPNTYLFENFTDLPYGGANCTETPNFLFNGRPAYDTFTLDANGHEIPTATLPYEVLNHTVVRLSENMVFTGKGYVAHGELYWSLIKSNATYTFVTNTSFPNSSTTIHALVSFATLPYNSDDTFGSVGIWRTQRDLWSLVGMAVIEELTLGQGNGCVGNQTVAVCSVVASLYLDGSPQGLNPSFQIDGIQFVASPNQWYLFSVGVNREELFLRVIDVSASAFLGYHSFPNDQHYHWWPIKAGDTLELAPSANFDFGDFFDPLNATIDTLVITNDDGVNECSSSPCTNGGTCLPSNGFFVCFCAPGWNGTTCQTNINTACNIHPCANGGTCHTIGANSLSCSCATGYCGASCMTDINECSSAPCKNGGSCLDGINSFSCLCSAGFSGTLCDTDINECASVPCQHGGSCTDTANGFTCVCVVGYSGAMCATDINECASAPCQHGGSCHDNINSFSCSCPVGWSGVLCTGQVFFFFFLFFVTRFPHTLFFGGRLRRTSKMRGQEYTKKKKSRKRFGWTNIDSSMSSGNDAKVKKALISPSWSFLEPFAATSGRIRSYCPNNLSIPFHPHCPKHALPAPVPRDLDLYSLTHFTCSTGMQFVAVCQRWHVHHRPCADVYMHLSPWIFGHPMSNQCQRVFFRTLSKLRNLQRRDRQFHMYLSGWIFWHTVSNKYQ